MSLALVGDRKGIALQKLCSNCTSWDVISLPSLSSLLSVLLSENMIRWR